MVRSNVKTLKTIHFITYSLLFVSLVTLSINTFAKDKIYPGELINIGTHRLHIHCIGTGSPSVIIDSGIGGFSLEWIKVQNNLSENVRICSYDRAGYGWSDPGPRPRTTERISSELRRLLSAAKVSGPYILVGHSFGGYNVRYFASKYPQLTAGLVLVDSSHPEQFDTEEFKRIKLKKNNKYLRYKNSYQVRIVNPVISDNYPDEFKRTAFLLMSTMKSKSTLLNELDYMEASAKQVSKLTNHPPYSFPVTILTRGKRVWAYDDLGDRREQQWSRLQNDLQYISMNSNQYLAEESGHIIHLDQPEFVSNYILATVDNVRSQLDELKLVKKFDIRIPSFAAIPSLAGPTTTFHFHYDDGSQNQESILDKFIQQVMFDDKMRHFGNHSAYFLR